MNAAPCIRMALLSCTLALGLALGGCDASERKAKEGLEEFQAAQMNGDLEAQQKALSKVVAAQEDNANAWASLGKVQMELGRYPDAFNSFNRALDFNRDNPDLLRILVSLSLTSGNLDLADQYVEKLEVISPGDQMTMLTKGLIALQRRNLADVEAIADDMIAKGVGVSDARILKSQVMLRQGKEDEAIALLEDQLRSLPDNGYIMQTLASIYSSRGEWAKVATLKRRMWEMDRSKFERAVDYVEAALKAGDTAGAMQVSEIVLTPAAPAWRIDQMMETWTRDWPKEPLVRGAFDLAQRSGPLQRLSYAEFLTRARASQQAMALVGPLANSLSGSAGLRAKAIMAENLAIMGRNGEAQRLIDSVIAEEPDNVGILRVKTMIDLETGQKRQTINDARRLSTLSSDSARDRLLLADAYVAAGDRRSAIRSLWDTFHDLPARADVYERLRKELVAEKQDVSGLDREYKEQVGDKSAKELLL